MGDKNNNCNVHTGFEQLKLYNTKDISVIFSSYEWTFLTYAQRFQSSGPVHLGKIIYVKDTIPETDAHTGLLNLAVCLIKGIEGWAKEAADIRVY